MTDKTQGLDRRAFLARASLTTVASILPGRFSAQEGKSDRRFQNVIDFLQSEIKAGTVPGAGLVASQHDNIVLEQYLGTYCNSDRRDNPFNGAVRNILFSTSKLIAATVIVMVQQDGLFDYDAPVSTYIPEFVGGGKDKITVRHLLSHSAGIPAAPVGSVETPEKWQQGIKAVCAAKVDWPPGSRSAYHGLTGHFVPAEIACRVTKKPWPVLCKERLFDPLGATTLSYDPPPPNAPASLVPQPEKVPSQYGKFGTQFLGHPSGWCIGTPRDVLKVLQLHLHKGVWQGKTLIKPDTFKEMHRVQHAKQIAKAYEEKKPPLFQSWGLGILVRGDAPHDGSHAWFGFGKRKSPGIFGHAGIDAFMAVADPELDLAIVFCTTDSPTTKQKATLLRNGVTDRISEAVLM